MVDLVTQIQHYTLALAKKFSVSLEELSGERTPAVSTELVSSAGQSIGQAGDPIRITQERGKLHAKELFALIQECDQLIASLPAEFESEEAQMETIRRLEQENEESVRRTAQLQQEAEELAKQVSAAVAFTATAQFQTLQSG